MARRRSKRRRGRKSGASRTLRNWLVGLGALALIVLALRAPPERALRHWWGERQGLVRVEGHAATIVAAARESGLDPNLLAGVMMVESRGHVDAVSKADALGLFQLKLATAEERAGVLKLPRPSKQDLLHDASLNARLGANYLAWLCKRFDGEEERALIGYNAGPGRLKRWIEEAGSYAAWRDARERAGDSKVLAYARDVQDYRARFAERGNIVPPAARAPEPIQAPQDPAVTSEIPGAPELQGSPAPIGPPAPTSKQ
ncbi:MAG TPA: lytic transglycosylase domain-containing protein [Planctomycetota bacterium]|nr:lytic transglycosylase domain-containing protein [Planctomycetota bacterium]